MYYTKVNGEVLLTNAGHFVLSFFGLTMDDLKVMSKEELIAHTKKFSDVLNDGKITKTTKSYRTDRPDITGGNFKTYKGSYQIEEPRLSNYGDSGSYSRYFSLDAWSENKTFPFIITSKASKSEKNKGCEDLEPQLKHLHNYEGRDPNNPKNFINGNPPKMSHNFHPTVKPLKLFSYLITMGSRENDLVLDPFCGSGTTCIAAEQLHRKWIGIELNPDYYTIARARIVPYLKQSKLLSIAT